MPCKKHISAFTDCIYKIVYASIPPVNTSINGNQPAKQVKVARISELQTLRTFTNLTVQRTSRLQARTIGFGFFDIPRRAFQMP